MQPDRPVQTTLAFHASRIVIDVGVLLAMASLSLTFVSSPSGGRSALAADALPAVLLLLPIFAVTLIPDHTRPLHPVAGWASMVLALAALPYAFVKMLDARVLADTLGGSVGIGPMILLLGCIVTLVGIGIGIVRDLIGKPSGGTPQRSAAYETKRRRAAKPAATRPQQAATQGPNPAAATAVLDTPAEQGGEAETRIIPAARPTAATEAAAESSEPKPTPRPAPASQPGPAPRPDSATRPQPQAAPEQDQPRQQPSKPSERPQPAQPEIVFPDTGAVAREAEPEEEPEDELMSTAERADAALTDHLLSMFDEDDFDDGPEDQQ